MALFPGRRARAAAKRDAEVEAELDLLRRSVRDLGDHLRAVHWHVDSLEQRATASLRGHEHRIAIVEEFGGSGVAGHVMAAESFVASLPPSDLLVSVVLTTRGRPELLRRAIASLERQHHQRWQLVVVDNGTDPGTAAVVLAAEDPRIELVEGPRTSAAAGRNAGLLACRGEVVAYCDDDNVMQPLWLAAVARAFARPDAPDVVYGVLVHQTGWEPEGQGRPELIFPVYDPLVLREVGLWDLGQIAHRRLHPQARFDESCVNAEDWDLMIRLCEDRPPEPLAVRSHLYCCDATDRQTDHPSFEDWRERIRERHAAR